ncbi:MAG TPA: iron ABC transporter permease [Burkholderiaceae bacterium]|nr:iron ABC transporter permease [Burkholderiaceae bacterium]
MTGEPIQTGAVVRAVDRRGGTRPRVTRATLLAIACTALVGLPVLSIFASFTETSVSADTLRHLAATVIPAALLETALLAIGVAVGVVAIGAATGWLTATCDFPGRRFCEWALLLPLAMPAYIVAYAYTDALQFSGPVQGALRAAFDWHHGDYWFPEIRSVAGGVFVFSVVLYPYVYLLARTAFLARTASMIDAARSLGLTAWQTWWQVNLPLARPAIAAGALLALMETLADYGATAYFGLQTFTVAIYRAWFALGDRTAASQLAAVLLVLVLVVLAFERRARGRARFFTPTASQRPAPRSPLRGARAAAGLAACAIPILLGFAVPVLLLVRLLLPAWNMVDWARFIGWLSNTVGIAVAGAALVLVTVLGLAYAARAAERGLPQALAQVAVRLMSLGYALPGAVVAIGILVPLAQFDNGLDGAARRLLGTGTGLLLTGSVFALLYGYLVRYFAVAFQSVEAGLARITPAMDASARSLGSSPLQTFMRVHLPILAPSVLAAALLVLVDVMKELPATLVLRPFNFDTLAVIAYQMASDERLGEAALPALSIVAVGALPVVLLSRAIARAAPGA